MRTRVGKIMKKENKSGAGQPERSVRDKEIMDTSGFLTQHIVPGNTNPSGEGHTYLLSEERGYGIGKRSRPSSATPSSTSSTAASTSSVAPVPSITQTDLSEALRQAPEDCLQEGHMQAIPEDSWHYFEINCLNLVQRFRQRGQATQNHQRQQQQPPTWQSPEQQSWQSSQQQQQQLHSQAWQQPSYSWQSSQQQTPAWPRWTGTSDWDPGMPAAPSSTPVPVPSPPGQSVPATRQCPVSQSPTFKTPVTPPNLTNLTSHALTPGSSDSSLEGPSPPWFRNKDIDTPPTLRVSPGSGGVGV